MAYSNAGRIDAGRDRSSRSARVIYSYTQISQYLRCPRSYRYRYLDGWSEKESKASMMFGRCFEKALAAYFRGDDCTATLFKGWGAYGEAGLDYSKGDSWDKLLHQGVHLLEMFARDDRIRIPHPEKNLQLEDRPSPARRKRIRGLHRCHGRN